MAGPRQPINLVIAKGNKHLTKEEIKERRSSEVQPVTDDIAAPSFLTAKQKKEFDRIAEQLQKLKIMGETDCDTLARYVVAQELYAQAVKNLRVVQKQLPKDMAPLEMTAWAEALDKLDKRCDRYFKQATTAASALGLTISSRCKLVVPVKDEAPKANKFAQFGKAAGSA
ncbi:MAG: phage terminase small subunit P27 family [Oscillospiraceae bacterium]|nr:phage terminase small subunit P27 family [Oscillospiraceae bacterium]